VRIRLPSCAMLITAGQLLILFMVIYPKPAAALLPKEIVVVANSRVHAGQVLATRYIRARNLPKENMLRLDLDDSETILRKDYDQRVAEPLRAFLKRLPNGNRVRCLLLMYGMPLKVEAPPLTHAQKKRLQELSRTIDDLRLQLSKITYKSGAEEEKLKQRLEKANLERSQLEPEFSRASLDSELMLILADPYPLGGWQANPFFLGFRDRKGLIDQDRVLMVSRLDGPNPTTVRRILADTFVAEKKGLKGTAYFDARWPASSKPKTSRYEFYDQSIHQAARMIKKKGQMKVVLDQNEALFKPQSCPNAALYCGWYSLAAYVPAFKWGRGAVGYHIASAECTTLRKGGSQVWCKRMIEEGIAATLGPVEEPYVQAFPLPSIFFSYLVEGRLTLAECYLLSIPYLSWKMVLIGDPLYRPFAAIIDKNTW